MLKRFKQSKKVWVGYAHFLMKVDRHDEARALLQRSLKSLREHKRKLSCFVVSCFFVKYIFAFFVRCDLLK